jgi:hypothetical protein
VVLVVATSLVTWYTVTHPKSVSCLKLEDYDTLDRGFYSVVVKGRSLPNGWDAFEAILNDVRKGNSIHVQKSTFCFFYTDSQGTHHDEEPPGNGCPNEDSPLTQGGPNPSMSVLSHKIYSIRASDIEEVSQAIGK